MEDTLAYARKESWEDGHTEGWKVAANTKNSQQPANHWQRV